MSFPIAWEVMSVGRGRHDSGERISSGPVGSGAVHAFPARVGAVGILLALLLSATTSLLLPSRALWIIRNFNHRHASDRIAFSVWIRRRAGNLSLYQWFRRLMFRQWSDRSNFFRCVLNAASLCVGTGHPAMAAPFWGMGRRHGSNATVIVGVLSASSAIFYAFQEEDRRRLLSFSSAENASVAIAVLGVSALFLCSSLASFASLAWTVALLHLAAHSLAKGTLFDPGWRLPDQRRLWNTRDRPAAAQSYSLRNWRGVRCHEPGRAASAGRICH